MQHLRRLLVEDIAITVRSTLNSGNDRHPLLLNYNYENVYLCPGNDNSVGVYCREGYAHAFRLLTVLNQSISHLQGRGGVIVR